MERKCVNEKKKRFMTFEERRKAHALRPKRKYLWSGIKEKSFGLVFGPAKSGKTIFCENLAMNLAMGSEEYFGYPLSGVPVKVLFMGLEEFWEDSTERNIKQFEVLGKHQKALIDSNLMYETIDFENMILTEENWKNLIETIKDSKAEVVFIDSITRMCPGKMENSDTAHAVIKKLRDICHELRITLICIHHTPKMHGSPITADKIKGSVVFQQEIDFAIGINRTPKGHRYQKNVTFRYASSDDEFVKEFEIDNSCWLNYIEDVEEDVILTRMDRRRSVDKREKIIKYLNSNSNEKFSTSVLVGYLKTSISLEDRQIKKYLTELSNNGKIGSEYGYYYSINHVKKNDDEGENKNAV